MLRVVRAVAMLLTSAMPAFAQTTITSATYEDPTTRYPHAVLGDSVEYGALTLGFANGTYRSFVLPDTLVFEDTAPRLADVTGDGAPEVVVVQSHQQQGARLAVFGPDGLITATPYIGRRFRWLAPIGVADLDGDGHIEVAYIDRPHLAKTLRVWRYEDGGLTQIASLPGYTNHRIGEPDIAGGIRHCGFGQEMIVATDDWRRVMALSFESGIFSTRDLGPHKDRSSFTKALAC